MFMFPLKNLARKGLRFEYSSYINIEQLIIDFIKSFLWFDLLTTNMTWVLFVNLFQLSDTEMFCYGAWVSVC